MSATSSKKTVTSITTDRTVNGRSSDAVASAEKGEETRESWGNGVEFLLSCIGLSVGLGNVWRFPYLCYKNGGGAFLIPYLIMLTIAGRPMYFMELCLGQFASLGPLTIWHLSPIMKGVGAAMVLGSIVVCIYYNVVMSYALYYMYSSFSTVLPWTTCDAQWAKGTNCIIRSANVSFLNQCNIKRTYATHLLFLFLSPSPSLRLLHLIFCSLFFSHPRRLEF